MDGDGSAFVVRDSGVYETPTCCAVSSQQRSRIVREKLAQSVNGTTQHNTALDALAQHNTALDALGVCCGIHDKKQRSARDAG